MTVLESESTTIKQLRPEVRALGSSRRACAGRWHYASRHTILRSNALCPTEPIMDHDAPLPIELGPLRPEEKIFLAEHSLKRPLRILDIWASASAW